MYKLSVFLISLLLCTKLDASLFTKFTKTGHSKLFVRDQSDLIQDNNGTYNPIQATQSNSIIDQQPTILPARERKRLTPPTNCHTTFYSGCLSFMQDCFPSDNHHLRYKPIEFGCLCHRLCVDDPALPESVKNCKECARKSLACCCAAIPTIIIVAIYR